MQSQAEGSNAPQAKEEPVAILKEEQVHQVEVEAENSLEVCKERKQEGTDFFRKGEWNEALVAYRAALNCLPRRPEAKQDAKATETSEVDDDADESSIDSTATKSKQKEREKEVEVVDVSSPAVSEADQELIKLRAVLNANIGACFLKLGDHKKAVDACSQAILDDPSYVKALERRAACNEIINSWSSLTSAQEDYNTLLKLVTSPSQAADLRRKLQSLKPRLEAAQKRETDEMIGKLKGLGNSVLGKFGLSTDNFKFEPNRGGGYSMNFVR
ncbi:hypothetical protein D9619_003040 [Psilocybe cf. subviscida]|uniref:Tetratricopeptide repeat protein 1 n=1 Tax=Psilocybe cf. subviscida TaxID=2480587 RepID=A0A8H5AW20_9AGAR|nr:hypothetical protein D9619_003040 [Psilocybe cf. subviscida]